MYNNIWYFHNCCSFTYIDCKKYVCNFFLSLCRHLHRNGKTVTRLLISVASGRQVGVEGGRRVIYILYNLVLAQVFMWPYYERETWIKYQRKKRRCAILRKISSVQLLSRVWLFVTPWTAPCQASLSITNSWSLFKLMSIEKVMPSKPLILCCLLLLKPSIFPSIRVFSNESALHIRWPKYWSFSFNIRTDDVFQSCGHLWIAQICWHIDCCIFTASSFRIWNSSTWIPSPPLVLFIVMLSKAGPLDLTFQDIWVLVSDHAIMIIWVMKIFFVQFFCVFLPPLLNNFCFCWVYTISFLNMHIFAWNVPLVSLIFLKSSSLSHPIVFLYFFTLITEQGFLISPCYS